MECPRCRTSNLSVVDSRDYDGETIRRRRECDACRFRFTTYERIEPLKLMVMKRTGGLEPYQRTKILRGIALAAEKRGFDEPTLAAVADRVETKIFRCAEEQLTSEQIGEYVMQELKNLDEVAYLRFVSVYRSFASLEAFEREVATFKATFKHRHKPDTHQAKEAKRRTHV